MSAKSEAADAAAKAVAKGALNLIRWGKKIIPATDDEIAKFGPNAANVKALINTVGGLSDDSLRVAANARQNALKQIVDTETSLVSKLARFRASTNPAYSSAAEQAGRGSLMNAQDSARAVRAAGSASAAEVVSDLIGPQSYRIMTNPLAAARRFDMTVPNAPEGFTNIARSLGERGLITAPKDIELARRVSMLPPAMQQVYLDLVGEGTDLAQLLQALRLMGQ